MSTSSHPLGELLDAAGAAARLGISLATFADWEARASQKGGGISGMPVPIGSAPARYRANEIEEFGRRIALKQRGVRTVERQAGRYFTPHAAANLMAAWAMRGGDEVIIEPSLGDGQFAEAVERWAGVRGWATPEVHACELDPATARVAVERGVIDARYLHVGDFLSQGDLPAADVVIGNPPYVRVRELQPPLRQSAHRAAEAAMGAAMDRAGSVWMPFVARATQLLRPGGRLAFVLPLDFTYVRYARPLWRFLGESFGKLTVLRFRQRVFPEILQNVLILLAEDRGGRAEHVQHLAAASLANVGGYSPTERAWLSPDGQALSAQRLPIDHLAAGERLFQRALLPAQARDALEVLEQNSTAALARMKFSVGYVSGNKKFFHPSPSEISTYRLPASSLIPTVESSRQLVAGGMGTSTLEPTARLWLPEEPLTRGEQLYVEAGESAGVDLGYKCRIRTPWYRVPGVRRPDLLLTAFSDQPRLYLNDAQWVASNSVLGGRITSGELPQQILSSWYTPLTLLSAELNIHSLGGGVMIAVPREADAVRILTANASEPLAVQKLDDALRTGGADAAYALGDSAVRALVGRSGLDAIYEGIGALATWRKAK